MVYRVYKVLQGIQGLTGFTESANVIGLDFASLWISASEWTESLY